MTGTSWVPTPSRASPGCLHGGQADCYNPSFCFPLQIHQPPTGLRGF